MVQAGNTSARPLRIYYEHRSLSTVHQSIFQVTILLTNNLTVYRWNTWFILASKYSFCSTVWLKMVALEIQQRRKFYNIA